MVALLHWWTISNMTDFIACFSCRPLDTLLIRECLLGYFFDRNENSPFLFSMLARNLCQLPGIFCLSHADTLYILSGTCTSFPIVPPFIVSARYWSHYLHLTIVSIHNDLVGRRSCRNINQRTRLEHLYQEQDASILHHKL